MRIVIIALLAIFLIGDGAEAQVQNDPAKRFALLIANLNYSEAVGRLTNPKRDIEVVASALRALGFPEENIIKKEDLTAEQMRSAVQTYADKVKAAGPGAWSFFYYAGHGAAAGQASAAVERGDNFLIPVDIDNTSRPDLWQRSVGLKQIGEILGEASEAVHFVVFDACRVELKLPDRTIAARGFVPIQTSEQPGMLYAFSSAPNTPALDGVEGQDNSPYALALSKELTSPSEDHLHLFANVRTAVARETGRRQIPWIRDGFLDLVFLTPPPLPTPPGEIAPKCTAPPEVKSLPPLEWQPVADKKRLVFKRATVTLAEPRGDAPTIDDISKDYVHRILPGSHIDIGRVDGRAAWYRYTRDVGSTRVRYVSVDDVELR